MRREPIRRMAPASAAMTPRGINRSALVPVVARVLDVLVDTPDDVDVPLERTEVDPPTRGGWVTALATTVVEVVATVEEVGAAVVLVDVVLVDVVDVVGSVLGVDGVVLGVVGGVQSSGRRLSLMVPGAMMNPAPAAAGTA